jgi:hypothetical protein
MAGSNNPYIAKAAGPLTNPTAATLFTQAVSPIATVASTQVLKVAYATYRGYNLGGVGYSNAWDLVRFDVRASGRATYGAAGNFTPALTIGQVGTNYNFLPASPVTQLAALTPQAASAAGTGVWTILGDFTWDPNTGVISGTVVGQETVLVAGVATTTLPGLTAITPIQGYTAPQVVSLQSNTTPVTIPAATGEAVLFFAVTGLFSASNAANVAIQDMLQTTEI